MRRLQVDCRDFTRKNGRPPLAKQGLGGHLEMLSAAAAYVPVKMTISRAGARAAAGSARVSCASHGVARKKKVSRNAATQWTRVRAGNRKRVRARKSGGATF
jgi:hypothetical protein